LYKYDEMLLNNTVSSTSQDDIVTHQCSVLCSYLMTWLHWILMNRLYPQTRTPVLKVCPTHQHVWFQEQPKV